MTDTPFIRLDSNTCSLVLDCRGLAPSLLYWGAPLSGTTPEMLALLSTRQEAPCCAAEESPITLSPCDGSGFLGQPGLNVHRDGLNWTIYPSIESITQADAHQLTILSKDSTHNISLIHTLTLDPDSGVLSAETEIINTGDNALTVDWCAAPTLPVPAHLEQIAAFEGRWANEFQLRTLERFTGTYNRDNRCGRTSHDAFPGLIVKSSTTSEHGGEAYAFHLGWSGNHRLHTEILSDGRGYVQMGELLLPGEVILSPGQHYKSPSLYASYSNEGLSALSRQFHRFVRQQLTAHRTQGRPRPVHYNTWEAVYFDHKHDTLFTLAETAAELGVERFVLDDGWFNGRRNDRAGLGDWYVDTSIYPEGLGPLINKVESLGMEFGLWFEPEMVNPDSDLYRAHPDWVLGATPGPQILARNQLVLNLALKEVQDYLYERLDSLLSEYNIAYIKWDMNRELHQAAGATGRASVHLQTRSLYQLIERLRLAHPAVEIESCASGGGRADFGILQYTDRIWTSDSNDALDRLKIQKGFSHFFPAEVMGSHVGPEECHITGRKSALSLRAGVALFGHMGLEMNLLELAQAERETLQAAITLHKTYRDLVHSGELFRLETPAYAHSFGIVATNKAEALFSYTQTDNHISTLPARLRFAGLAADSLYRINVIWPAEPKNETPSILNRLDNALLSGESLTVHGLQMPLMNPENLLLISLHKENA